MKYKPLVKIPAGLLFFLDSDGDVYEVLAIDELGVEMHLLSVNGEDSLKYTAVDWKDMKNYKQQFFAPK